VIGYRDLAKLALAAERDHARTTIPPQTKEATILITADRRTGTAVAKFHDERDILIAMLGFPRSGSGTADPDPSTTTSMGRFPFVTGYLRCV